MEKILYFILILRPDFLLVLIRHAQMEKGNWRPKSNIPMLTAFSLTQRWHWKFQDVPSSLVSHYKMKPVETIIGVCDGSLVALKCHS
jgi:hypothetical protein